MEDDSNPLDGPEHLGPENVQKVFAAAEKKAADSQEAHNQAAQYAGYTKEVIRATAPFYVQLAELAQDAPQLLPYVASGVQFMDSLSLEFGHTDEPAGQIVKVLSGMSTSAAVFCSTSGTLSTVLIPSLNITPFDPPPSFLGSSPKLEEKLSTIDPALADTYREIGQAYHGTTADPERAAMSMMRQAFDHLFGKLAPDDKVIASPYWEPKPPEERTQVTRRERMTYTAYTYIADQARARTILATVDNLLETYELLNKLHTRGTLSEEQARRALRAMQQFLEAWADAIQFP